MGGAIKKADKFYSGGIGTKGLEKVGLIEGKKKKKLTASQRQAGRNQAARGASPLLQQTALSPNEPAGGAGTALL
jgi:hypothetical protein